MVISRAARLELCVRLLLLSALLLVAVATRGQNPPQANSGMQEKVALLKESIAQNQAALKAYSWTEATEISLKGEVKKREQKKCSYGPDGKVQKTVVPDSAAPKQAEQKGGGRRGGVVKKAVVENKVEDMKEYMEKAAALVHEYVPPDPQKIQAAAAAGKITTQPASSQGLATLTISDYIKPGDKLVLGLDPAAKKLRTYEVHSYVEKPKDDAVKLVVSFASLPDGTNYPQQTTLDVAAKKVNVKITNSGYVKPAQ
jgi:hypothetical protein